MEKPHNLELSNPTIDGSDIAHLAFPQQCDSIRHHKHTIFVNVHHFYLVEDILDSVKYIDMINIMKAAEEHDTIYLHINNGGGNLATTLQIISAMRESQAKIITSLEGEACSAATLIFLNGHEYIIHDNCIFMIHYYSSGVNGKGNDLESNVAFNKRYFRELYEDTYAGFLTDDEISKVINGQDIWLTSTEVSERLESFIAVKQEKFELSQQQGTLETLANVEKYVAELKDTIKAFKKK